MQSTVHSPQAMAVQENLEVFTKSTMKVEPCLFLCANSAHFAGSVRSPDAIGGG